jgi:hypothetical protein
LAWVGIPASAGLLFLKIEDRLKPESQPGRTQTMKDKLTGLTGALLALAGAAPT